jgi:hypothetical protein
MMRSYYTMPKGWEYDSNEYGYSLWHEACPNFDDEAFMTTDTYTDELIGLRWDPAALTTDYLYVSMVFCVTCVFCNEHWVYAIDDGISVTNPDYPVDEYTPMMDWPLMDEVLAKRRAELFAA